MSWFIGASKIERAIQGKFFELFDYKSEIKGGVLSSEGFIGALDNDNDIMGTLSIDNFKVMKAPLFAELLLAASFTGLFELLNNEGIEFEQFDAQFTGKDNIFLISKSRAYGFSLGITAEGEIDSIEKNIKLFVGVNYLITLLILISLYFFDFGINFFTFLFFLFVLSLFFIFFSYIFLNESLCQRRVFVFKIFI